ncbi:MAG: RelA/SpoT family protein [bacterium]
MKETLPELLRIISENYGPADTDLVKLAYEFAAEAHKGQLRKSGEPYITHPTAAAIILAEMKLELPIIVATLLHDVPEDTTVTIEDINKNFGPDVGQIVNGVTKLGKLKYRGMDRYIENLRKMFVAMATDVRVCFVKFADRLHNLSTLSALPAAKAKRIALESLEIYAPIANRLGMGEIQGRLEDAAFPFAYPEEYNTVKTMFEAQFGASKDYHNNLLEKVRGLMTDSSIKNFEVQGRVKHLYSLFRKLQKYEMDIAKIYDLMAVRILVPTVGDCYTALGIIHTKWTPLKGRIKDYIAQPKPNGYKSLHTTVFCEDGHIVEFQIRTFEMHEDCELGVAAHWHYDEAGKKAERVSSQLKWVQELAEIQEQMKFHRDPKASLEELKFDMFQHRIFVFTPQGDVIDLPEAATPVDFAFAIHTDVGMKCSSAKVNGEMSALDTELVNGDVVEIVTDKKRSGPSQDWLKFVKTHGARSKIKSVAKSKMQNWLDTLKKIGGEK